MTRLRRDGQAALHLATVENHLEVAKVLLKHGADVNTKFKFELM